MSGKLGECVRVVLVVLTVNTISYFYCTSIIG